MEIIQLLKKGFIQISELIRNENSLSLSQLTDSNNTSGDDVKKIDIISNDILKNILKQCSLIRKIGSEEEDEFNHVGKIADSIFMEAKIENVLMKYFNVNESEKKYNDDLSKQRIKEHKERISKRNSEIKRLSENIEQEIASRKFLQEKKSATLVGKTNKKNLVFEINNRQYKITPKGQIL